MKILIATDGSSFGTRAARYIAKHAKLFGSKPDILVLYVDPPLTRYVAGVMGPREVARYHAEAGQAALRGAASALRRAHVAYRERMVVGDPAAQIIDIARTEKSEMIVVGSRGRSALQSIFLGSVAAKVIAQSKVPVLVVR